MASCPRLHPQRSFCRRAVLPCSSDVVAGGPFFFAVTKISIGCGRPLPLWTLQAGHSSLLQRNLNRTRNSWSGGDRCHSGGFLLRIMPPSWYQSPPASSMPVAGETIPRQNPAVIRKSGLEIKNQCTKEGVNGEIPASIPKSGPEIKNQCTKDGISRQNHASIRKSGPEIKNQCTLTGICGEGTASIRKLSPEDKKR